jgi:hypothetical protein
MDTAKTSYFFSSGDPICGVFGLSICSKPAIAATG